MNWNSYTMNPVPQSPAERKITELPAPLDIPEEIIDVYLFRFEGSRINNPWNIITVLNPDFKRILEVSSEGVQDDLEIENNRRLHLLLIPEGTQLPRRLKNNREEYDNIKDLHCIWRDDEEPAPEIEDVI